jgi:hypothetical protein
MCSSCKSIAILHNLQTSVIRSSGEALPIHPSIIFIFYFSQSGTSKFLPPSLSLLQMLSEGMKYFPFLLAPLLFFIMLTLSRVYVVLYACVRVCVDKKAIIIII